MSESLPLVSILMTAYNREKYIGKAIESVLASSYRNFELIITDDRSKDNTVLIAEKYAAGDKRVKIYINDENLGDYPNRNKAASYAGGKYLKYVDADDLIYPWGLELLVTMMEKFPDAGWGLCSLDQFKSKPFPFLLTPEETYQCNYLNISLFHKAPLSSIIRRDIFNQEGGFAPLRMVGDNEMWHRLALHHNLLLMPQGIVWYREHGEQEIKDYSKFIVEYERISVRFLTSGECPLETKQARSVLDKRRSVQQKKLFRALVRFDLKRVKVCLQCLKLYNAR